MTINANQIRIGGNTRITSRLYATPECQPVRGTCQQLGDVQHQPPFEIQHVGGKNADNNQGHPERCFIIHEVYWPESDFRTSLVNKYGYLHKQRFNFGDYIFGCNAKILVKLVDRGGGAKAFHADKRRFLGIATLAG